MYIDLSQEPKTDRSILFNNLNIALDYLIERNLLPLRRNCILCNNEMRIFNRKKATNGRVFRCINNLCRKEISLLFGTKIEKFRTNINDIFLMIFKWLENSSEKDVLRNLECSKTLYQNLKNIIYSYIDTMKNNSVMLGGHNIKVQVDETAICHGFLKKAPSNLNDDYPGVTWLVGFIEENSRNIRYEIVENRRIETFKHLFERIIKRETIVITDGHLSYPAAVSHIQGNHIKVNHSVGFKNVEGFHTNNIENLWSLLKYEIKRRRGIKRSNLKFFLKEFQFRYTFMRKKNSLELFTVFSNIIAFIFKNE